jgi:hypothetical protein
MTTTTPTRTPPSDAVFESERVRLLRRNPWPYALPVLLAAIGCALVWIWTPHTPLLDHALVTSAPPPPPPPLIAGEPPLVFKAELFSRTLWNVWQQGQSVVPEQRRLATYLPYEIVGIVAVLVALSIYQVNPFAVRRRGKLRIDHRGGTWKGKRLFRREGLEQGLLRPGPRAVGVIVRLERKGWLPRIVEVLCDDAAEARRILWSLRFDAAQKAASFRIASLASTHALLGPIVTGLRIAMILVVGLMAISFGSYGFAGVRMVWIGAALGVLLLVLFVLRSWPVRVTVGTDGVLVQWMLVERFVPFPVRDVEAYEWGVMLVRHVGEGPSVDLCIFRPPWYVPKKLLGAVRWWPLWLSVQRDLLQSRLDAAMAARATHQPPDIASSQAPGDAAAWARQQRSETTEVRALTSDMVDFVEDPWAPPSLRASSAMTMWRDAAPTDPTHLRAIAEQTANPKLRELFEALAKGDRARARSALAKLEVTAAKGDEA